MLVFSTRKALVRLFDKIEQGTLKEGRNLSNRIIELHKKRYVMVIEFVAFLTHRCYNPDDWLSYACSSHSFFFFSPLNTGRCEGQESFEHLVGLYGKLGEFFRALYMYLVGNHQRPLLLKLPEQLHYVA